MSTGDMKNNLKKLQTAVKLIKYEKDIDIDSLSKGIPGSFLPIYHFVFIEYSRHMAEKVAELNIELLGKSDLRFVESMYKVLREVFSYKPPLTKDQFFSNGFAEKKVIMCTTILNHVRTLHGKLAPKPRPKTAPTNMTTTLGAVASTSTVNHKLQPKASAPVAAKPPTGPKAVAQNVVPRNAAFSNISLSKQAPSLNIQVEKEGGTQGTATGPTYAPQSMRAPTTVPAWSAQQVPDVVNPQAAAPAPYNPAAYGAEEELVVREQQRVEVVSLDSDTSDDNLRPSMRPIDVIPKTPGKPLVQAHRHTGDGVTDASRQLMASVEIKLSAVTQTLTSLVARMEALENKMATVEAPPQQPGVPMETVENILARLTLLENNYQLVKAQMNKQAQPQQQMNGHVEALSDQHVGGAERAVGAGEHRGPAVSEELEPDSLEMHTPSYAPRATVHSFNDAQMSVVPTMTSTPVEPLPAAHDPGDSATQVDRIAAMMKHTEKLLNIQVESPLRMPAANN